MTGPLPLVNTKSLELLVRGVPLASPLSFDTRRRGRRIQVKSQIIRLVLIGGDTLMPGGRSVESTDIVVVHYPALAKQ